MLSPNNLGIMETFGAPNLIAILNAFGDNPVASFPTFLLAS